MKPARLICIVSLASASFAFAQAPQQQTPPPPWKSQVTSAVHGIVHTQFTLLGKYLKAPQGEVTHGPALVVECIPSKGSHGSKGRFVSANLLAGTTFKIDYVEPEEIHGTSYYPKVFVEFRLDDAKEEKEKWSPGNNKTSASIPKDSLKKILRGHVVEISADDDDGSHLVMHFDMPDPAPVEQACNVDEPKK